MGICGPGGEQHRPAFSFENAENVFASERNVGHITNANAVNESSDSGRTRVQNVEVCMCGPDASGSYKAPSKQSLKSDLKDAKGTLAYWQKQVKVAQKDVAKIEKQIAKLK
jgi:hypothetical protein